MSPTLLALWVEWRAGCGNPPQMLVMEGLAAIWVAGISLAESPKNYKPDTDTGSEETLDVS
jgi:hypothetical protein